MRKIHYLLMSVLLIATGLALTQCKKSDVVIVPDPFALKLANSATLGSYLTDKDGNALYFFANDANGANNCTGDCTTNWPKFYSAGLTQGKLVTGLDIADFDSITTTSGKQITYKGWPLYYYAPAGVRETSGQTSGDGVNDGKWFVAKPDYSIMIANLQLVGKDTKNYVVSATNVYSEGVGLTKYFTDGLGRTLYAFARDSANINKYTNTDPVHNAVWPIYETDKMVVPSVLDKALFGSIMKYGLKQLTYKGWPMYYYGPDVDGTGKYRGSNKGVSVPVPNVWPVFFKDFPAAPHL